MELLEVIKILVYSTYSQRWIEQPFAARGKERRKERGNEGLKINLEIIIILILTVNSDKNRIQISSFKIIILISLLIEIYK